MVALPGGMSQGEGRLVGAREPMSFNRRKGTRALMGFGHRHQENEPSPTARIGPYPYPCVAEAGIVHGSLRRTDGCTV